MKQLFKPRRLIIMLAGLMFAAYSAYNIFIIIRDYKRGLPPMGIFICAVVAAAFAVLAVFAFTSEVKNLRFLIIRKNSFIAALVVIFLLKLRMLNEFIAFINFSKLHTIIYTVSYVMFQTALVLLFIYYTVILKNLMHYPKASVVLPLISMILFFGSLVCEAVLFFVYNIGIEDNILRTVVMRPVFYLGFVFLSAHFLFPPELPEDNYNNFEETPL